MASKKADWKILRGTLIGFVICLLLSAGMLTASFYFKQSMQTEYQRHHRDFRAASQQYLAVDEEERIIEEFYPEFVRLYRGGLLGQEKRLSWLETLRDAGEAIKIPELNYQLEPQRETANEQGIDLGGYGIYVSPMNLTLGLLHEEDVLRLLGALDRDARGQYSVRECEFRSEGTDFALDPGRTNIRASCVLDWLTLDLAGDQELTL